MRGIMKISPKWEKMCEFSRKHAVRTATIIHIDLVSVRKQLLQKFLVLKNRRKKLFVANLSVPLSTEIPIKLLGREKLFQSGRLVSCYVIDKSQVQMAVCTVG